MNRALLAGLAAAAIGCGVLVVRSRFIAVDVSGESMEPTLHAGDRVLVRRTPLRRVRRGQLVVFAPPPGLPAADSPPWLVKRLVALPGDAVPAVLGGDGLVPPGRFVALGDNAARSFDSRRAGYFPAESLLGVVVRTLR